MGSDKFPITEIKSKVDRNNVDNKCRLRTFFCDVIHLNMHYNDFFEKLTNVTFVIAFNTRIVVD